MPKQDHPPSFPFYVDDFIADSAVDAMSNQELGIYIRLLCKAWKEDPVGTLPVDDHLLARWAKETPAIWRKCKAGVFRAFKIEDGRLHQKRMKEVWDKVLEYREAKSRAGKKGMERRWQNDNTAITEPITKNNLPSPSPSSFSTNSKDVDVIGNVLSGDEPERLRAKARHIQKATKIDTNNLGDRELIAKTAVLWDAGEFSEADIESVLQSFKSGNIKNRGAYLHRSLANQCTSMHKDFGGLLARTTVPMCLLIPAGGAA